MQNESVAILAFIALAMLALSLACMFVEMRNEEKRKLKRRRAFAAPTFEPASHTRQRERDLRLSGYTPSEARERALAARLRLF